MLVTMRDAAPPGLGQHGVASARRAADRSRASGSRPSPAAPARWCARPGTRRRGRRDRRARRARRPARCDRRNSRRRSRCGMRPRRVTAGRLRRGRPRPSSRASPRTASGPVKRWCSPSSMPVRPTTRNVAGVSGLTGKPVVIWPSSAAWPTCARRHAERAGDFGDDRQDAEIEGVGIEEQAERHRHDRQRDRDVRRQRAAARAPTAACAIAVEHAALLHDAGEGAGGEEDAPPSSAPPSRARRCARAARRGRGS